tara:strand:- start:928 stop:1308 length:381 start_codon:yes stop_codon:yes gene_type:complete
MTIQVTPCDVKAFCTTSLSDQAINALICVVQAKMGECVESNYDECVGKMVLTYAVCHMVESQTGEKTQVRAANGASITKQYHGTGEGVKSTSAGRSLIMIDSAGCYNNLFVSPLLFATVGNAASPC